LVTTSPSTADREVAGVLGQDTSVVFGGTSLNTDMRSGGRFSIGSWLRADQLVGIEASYLFLGRESTAYGADSDGIPILARPFFNIVSGAQSADLIAFENVSEGSIGVDASTEFDSVEVLFRRGLFADCAYRMDFLAGWRYGMLDDHLSIHEVKTSVDPQGPAPVGTVLDRTDVFDTRNEFNGGALGVVLRGRRCRWSLELLMKLALGSTTSTVRINGSTTTTIPGDGTETYTGGLLAQGTNIGSYSASGFAIMPELGVRLSYDFTPRLCGTFGYTFLYLSRVARPGDQIDLDLNPSQFPPGELEGAPRPEFDFVFSDFWAQGMSLGLEYRF